MFERDAAIGGIMRFGIPDFKMEKCVLDRRIAVWEKEGIVFKTGVYIGRDIGADQLLKEFDAVCLTCGSRVPRDMNIEGRELKGIHFAMDYLIQSNNKVTGRIIPENELINAAGKNVVVIGGGDTGSDCVGTAIRQGAKSVTQLEILPKPPVDRPVEMPWPTFPVILKTSTSHQEGVDRRWQITTKKFAGDKGSLKKLVVAGVYFEKDTSGRNQMKEAPGSETELPAELVILAMGFLYPEKAGLVENLGLELDQRGNIKTGVDYKTSKDKVFSAGDMRRGQSLVVWAISEGRRAAHSIDKYLMGKSNLPII